MKYRDFKYKCISIITRSLMALPFLPKSIRAPFLISGIIAENRSMLSKKRLYSLYSHCASPLLPNGSLVECGIARGGSAAVMSLASGGKRAVWGFDSFDGMPSLTAEDQSDGQKWVGYVCSGPNGLEEAQQTFSRFHVNGKWVNIVPGWFEETLPNAVAHISQIAVLRLDNDWYKSTRFCLETLYASVVPGGIVIIDDYNAYVGCKTAVDEFRERLNITSPLITTESFSEVYWQKT